MGRVLSCDRSLRRATLPNDRFSPGVTFSAELGKMAPSDLVLCVGSEHVFGTLNQALSELRDLVRPGGRLLLGTQIWKQTPTADLVAAVGGGAESD